MHAARWRWRHENSCLEVTARRANDNDEGESVDEMNEK